MSQTTKQSSLKQGLTWYDHQARRSTGTHPPPNKTTSPYLAFGCRTLSSIFRCILVAICQMWPRDFQWIFQQFETQQKSAKNDRKRGYWMGKKIQPTRVENWGMILVLQSQPILDTLYFCELVNICSHGKK